MTGSADSDIAKTDTHSLPTASRTATSPSVQACIAGRSWISTASELPVPSRSVKISRPNDARRRSDYPGTSAFVVAAASSALRSHFTGTVPAAARSQLPPNRVGVLGGHLYTIGTRNVGDDV
jgi:hypothetical protein